MFEREQLRALIKKQGWRSSIAILGDWVFIILIVAVNERLDSLYLYIPSIWLIGLFQFALGETMLHEASHGNLFHNNGLNNRLECFYALPFLRTVRQYRVEHRQHHQNLGKADDEIYKDYKNFGFFSFDPKWFWLLYLKPLTGFAGYYYCLRLRLKPFREGGKIIVFWLTVVCLFAVFGKLNMLLYYWIIPYFWGFYSFLYWSEVSDHLFTNSGTRTNINRLTNFFTHNNGFHSIHHRFPGIPWFNLPKAHKVLKIDNSDISRGIMNTYIQIRQNAEKERSFDNHF